MSYLAERVDAVDQYIGQLKEDGESNIEMLRNYVEMQEYFSNHQNETERLRALDIKVQLLEAMLMRTIDEIITFVIIGDFNEITEKAFTSNENIMNVIERITERNKG